MTVLLAESVAGWVYARTQCSTLAPPGPGVLLARLVGDRGILFGPPPVRAMRWGDGLRVVLPTGLASEDLCVAAAAGVALAASFLMPTLPAPMRMEGPLVALATKAIAMPRLAVLGAVGRLGAAPGPIARAFVVPEDFARDRMRQLGIHSASGEYESGTWRTSLVDPAQEA